MTPTHPTLVRHPLQARLLQVCAVQDLAPCYRRITLQGDLAGFTSLAPDDHVKLLFPPAGHAQPALPQFGPQGPRFAADQTAPDVRDYTPRAFDLAAGTLVMEFVIHGHGPASRWAAAAAPGQWLGVAGPRGSRVVPDVHDAYLLVGDETAMPAMGRWLDGLPAHRTSVVVVEVAGPADEFALPVRARGQVHWVHRGAVPAGEGGLLTQAVSALAWPSGSVYAWVAGESSQMRQLRQHLQTVRGLDAAHLHAAGYWKRGAADHDSEH